MRFALMGVAALAAAAGVGLRARGVTHPQVEPKSEVPQPLGITAALLMDACFPATKSGALPADVLPVPHRGKGPLTVIGDANDARRAGAHYFVPVETMYRTTHLTHAEPSLEITPRDVWTRRDRFQIVDLREEDEFAASRVPGSRRESMFTDFTRQSKPVALFCLTGHRSAAVVMKLRRQGTKNVYSVRGGWLDWQHQKLPLVEFAHLPHSGGYSREPQ